MNICVIPARGGSKRIPRKNIRNFHGKPIIVWAIEAARKSGCFDKIVVSTDDQEIADIAKMNGACVPFFRPEELSDDYVGMVEVMQHAVSYMSELEPELSSVCMIFSTSPLIQVKDIKAGFDLLPGNDYVTAVTGFSSPIQRALFINPTDKLEMFLPENYFSRSQDLTPAFYDAGQFVWGTKESWLEGRQPFNNNTAYVELPRLHVVDIDTPEDWQEAEIIFELLNKSGR